MSYLSSLTYSLDNYLEIFVLFKFLKKNQFQIIYRHFSALSVIHAVKKAEHPDKS